MSEFELRVGGTYVSKDGEVVGPLRHVTQAAYPEHTFRAGVSTYNKKGWWLETPGSQKDLVREVVELREGGRYLMGNGMVGTAFLNTRGDWQSTHPYRLELDIQTGFQPAYTADGVYAGDCKPGSPNDIIMEVFEDVIIDENDVAELTVEDILVPGNYYWLKNFPRSMYYVGTDPEGDHVFMTYPLGKRKEGDHHHLYDSWLSVKPHELERVDPDLPPFCERPAEIDPMDDPEYMPERWSEDTRATFLKIMRDPNTRENHKARLREIARLPEGEDLPALVERTRDMLNDLLAVLEG